MLPQEGIIFTVLYCIFEESFLGCMYVTFCFIAPNFKVFPVFLYIENFTTKKENENFQINNSDIFHISAPNIDCGCSLEPPQRGGSNEYPQSMFGAEIKKIMYTSVNPSFTV